MKFVLLKGSNDKSSFKIFEFLGAEVEQIEDLEKTDDKIRELVNKNYRTIVITNEVASFSESIVKKYDRTKDIKIIIAPSK